MDTAWNDDRTAALKHLWADGLSASRIAARIGGVSRQAVIGKARRLGLPGRTQGRKPRVRMGTPEYRARMAANGRRGGKSTALAKPGSKPPAPPPPETAAPPRMVPLLKLEASMCRWPYGDPRKPGFGFCGQRTMPGQTYCPAHHAKAFVRRTTCEP